MRVIFILPGLFHAVTAKERGFNYVQRLLARSELEPSLKADARLLLLSFLISGRCEALTESYLAYWSDFLRPPAGYCYYCEPVHLRADLSDAIVFDCSQFSLTLAEARSLVDAINQYLQDSFLKIELANGYRWYLMSEKEIFGRMPALREVQGRPAGVVLTDATLAPEWRRLMNELQILLHQQAINMEREQRGELPVNGVWIHAGTTLEIPDYAVGGVITRSSYAQTVSRGLGLDCGEELDESKVFLRQDDILIFDDSLAIGLDSVTRRSRLEWMESHWFKPVYAWLQRKKIDEIIIDACDGRRFVIRRNFLHRFWKRIYPLHAYME